MRSPARSYHTLKLSNTRSQKKSQSFGPSTVVGDCGEGIKGAPRTAAPIDTRLPQQRKGMPILGGVQTGPWEDEAKACEEAGTRSLCSLTFMHSQSSARDVEHCQ
jgi:hypothetical protein